MGTIMKWIVPFVLIAGIIKYRYKILNIVFGSYWIRKVAIRAVMSIPGIRNKFMENTFR
ncbi:MULTISPECIES: hypothetical protein [Heyndrickxia]|uniref:hypothetical protein n=1 Tax=Heyndrickxia TaxID=2837504 RepID=UPI000AD0479E|nr:hypothetical protein [Heyndrickxia shackletonii]MBB2480131.1 hypothetical protein [Bacillus sp. APMAM]NEY99620.1 hypothetical protein [Heyndrickxia shackletonii]